MTSEELANAMMQLAMPNMPKKGGHLLAVVVVYDTSDRSIVVARNMENESAATVMATALRDHVIPIAKKEQRRGAN